MMSLIFCHTKFEESFYTLQSSTTYVLIIDGTNKKDHRYVSSVLVQFDTNATKKTKNIQTLAAGHEIRFFLAQKTISHGAAHSRIIRLISLPSLFPPPYHALKGDDYVEATPWPTFQHRLPLLPACCRFLTSSLSSVCFANDFAWVMSITWWSRAIRDLVLLACTCLHETCRCTPVG